MKQAFYLLSALTLFSNVLNSQDSLKTKQPGKDPFKTEFSKGLKYEAADSTYSVKVGFRFQNLMILETTDKDPKNIEGKAMVRRARLKFDGFAFSPDIVYKIELGLSNSDISNPVPEGSNASNIMYDAVVKWKFAKNTALWFGQTKLPGNRERVISSQALQFVDRSNLNGEYNIDRDFGFQLHHEFKIGKMVIRDIYALSMGEGRNITATNFGGLDYTGRIEFLPFGKFTKGGDYVSSDIYREKTPKLSLAVSYDYNDAASKEKGQLGKFLKGQSDLQTVFADLMFKYRGFSVLAEYADKTGEHPLVYDTKGVENGKFIVGTGISIQSGYLFKNNWEIAGRYTEVNYDRIIHNNSTWMYTLGLSRYIVGHNLKVQSDISLIDKEFTAPHEIMFRLQMELAF